MNKYIIYSIASALLSLGTFFNSASAEDSIFFSRANCALPQDIFQFGKLRNESITWDPEEFYNRITNPNPNNWRYWGIKITSKHYQRTNQWVKRHELSDIERFGIHVAGTHLDIASQALWGVIGNHFYKGPFILSQKNSSIIDTLSYIRLPDTVATDCNLQISQFFG